MTVETTVRTVEESIEADSDDAIADIGTAYPWRDLVEADAQPLADGWQVTCTWVEAVDCYVETAPGEDPAEIAVDRFDADLEGDGDVIDIAVIDIARIAPWRATVNVPVRDGLL